MERKFFSVATKCNACCEYCFSKLSDTSIHGFFDIHNISNNTVIIYPACDGEFFSLKDNVLILEEIMQEKENVIISISTKNVLSLEQLQKISNLNSKFNKDKKGFIKLSVSFSCIDAINKIEKGTLQYIERLELIKQISEMNIPYATIIKPILPFVDFEEYKQLIDDTIKYSKYYVVGDLYIDKSSDFYKKYIKDKFVVKRKFVEWAQQEWDVVESLELKNKIKNYIINQKGVVFESDQDLLQVLYKNI